MHLKLKLIESENLNESWMTSQIAVLNALDDALRKDEELQDKDRASEFLEGIINWIKDYAKDNDLYLDENNFMDSEEFPKDEDKIDLENSTDEEIEKWLNANNDRREHSEEFNNYWLEVYKYLEDKKDKEKELVTEEEESEATQVEDIAKKEEYKNMVTPSFKIGKKITSLEESSTNEYGEVILTKDEAESKMNKIINKLNNSFKDEDYDFGYRIEDTSIKLFDKNEYFTYNSSNFNKVEEIVKSILGNIYLEPYNSVIMTIADCHIN